MHGDWVGFEFGHGELLDGGEVFSCVYGQNHEFVSCFGFGAVSFDKDCVSWFDFGYLHWGCLPAVITCRRCVRSLTHCMLLVRDLEVIECKVVA